MKLALDVLSVGSEEPMSMAYNVFLGLQGCVVAHASSCRELSHLPSNVDCDVAVLHHTLHAEELRDAARTIRGRWPKAKILLIRADAWCIEDPLYDERVEPGINPELLLSTINRITDRCPHDEAAQRDDVLGRKERMKRDSSPSGRPSPS